MPKATATSSNTPSSSYSSHPTWRPTKIMNMRDLSKDDDFLSHLLVEKLGTGGVPLYVHKMDSSRKLPKTNANDLLQIVRRLVMNKAPIQHTIRQAVDELLILPAVRYYLKSYEQKQINAFSTHASRYFELYHPSGSIEIAHTSRYAHRTGKSELCILATRNLAPGAVITELKGSMANLTEEEDKELKRNLHNTDIRRDFSVIHSKQMKKNHLFLGPARFVNHDCDNNCELFREGKYITFRVLRPIIIGEEITAHYGDGYFGRKNRHCLCETCEKNGRGGYAPDYDENEPEPNSNSDSDTESASSSSDSDLEAPDVNVNERRTRRGVYAVLKKGRERDADESDEDAEDSEKVAIELSVEVDAGSSTSETPPDVESRPSPVASNLGTGGIARSISSLSSLSSDTSEKPGSADKKNRAGPPFRSIIATRRQKAQEANNIKAPSESPSTDNGTSSHATRPTRRTRSSSTMHSEGRVPTPTRIPSLRHSRDDKDEIGVKKEDVEPRNLRTRPSVTQLNDTIKATPAREVPRGPDGKPLPLCVTCSDVLPVISVDSKVVWGLGLENSPKRKKQKLQCPRCMRHFAIYAQPWPCRLPPNGHSTSFLPTPCEEVTPVDNSTRRVTHKALPVLDRKLQAAAAAASGHPSTKDSSKRHNQNHEEERPAKRTRLDSAQETPFKSRKDSKSNDRMGAITAEPTKRRRGRPRIHFPEEMQPSEIKEEEKPVSLSSPNKQPRNPNGQFGRKDDMSNPTSPGKPSSSNGTRQVPIPEDKMDPANRISTPSISPRNRKRAIDVDEWEHPRKRTLRGHGNKYRDTTEPLEDAPLQKVLPRPTGFRNIRLLSNPNPLSFALQAWAGPVLLDESSSSDEEEKGIATPEDDQSPPAAIIAVLDDISPRVSPSPAYVSTPVLSRGALTYKPSPITFAKRRWASVSSDSPGRGQEGVLDPEQITMENRDSLNELSDQPDPLYKHDRTADKSNEEIDTSSRIRTSTELQEGHMSVHGYPTTRDAGATSHFNKSVTFPLPDLTPSFIHAGWDSCSELSDS
ncbi:hypothetical protein AX15_006804 [Amanita polypyramis BW_CC]|nr:hypothetical protein AX15_006804 [Amanita polypyramis BW_CC]